MNARMDVETLLMEINLIDVNSLDEIIDFDNTLHRFTIFNLIYAKLLDICRCHMTVSLLNCWTSAQKSDCEGVHSIRPKIDINGN